MNLLSSCSINNNLCEDIDTDAVDTYFECITTCSIDDGECVTRCVEQLKDTERM